ncbi:MAG: ATP-binding protein, partial [Pseudonocardiaceae bacterium]
MRRLLETLASSKPVVLVFDDLHWAEPVLIDLIETLAARCRDAPVLLLCPARPELLERHPRFGAAQDDHLSIRLEPLGADDSTRLVQALLGRASLPAETHARVTEFAGGNPLFIEELLGTLIDDELIRQENGGWVTTGDLSQIAIPPTLEALLASRLDRLGSDQRVTIECASVEGQVFHQDAVRALSPIDGGVEVPAALTALSNKQFIRSAAASVAGDVAFRFRHILIRDAAYRGVAKRTRADLHEQFAEWLENMAGARIPEYEEVIGYHLEQAYRYRAELGPIDETARARARRAAEHLGGAGRRALLTRGDMPAAVNLLERACSLVPEEDPFRRRLQIDLGAALVQAGELQRAGEVF